uniref:Uncharacterized protein n=1 Tax=Anguilla anguilla TaxID=7936 RepID=A0A0E9QXS6_ANGAN
MKSTVPSRSTRYRVTLSALKFVVYLHFLLQKMAHFEGMKLKN